jgi:hypothetical protein
MTTVIGGCVGVVLLPDLVLFKLVVHPLQSEVVKPHLIYGV